ncbi:hypothetical protein ABG067_005293 [Albugo candida]
MFMECPLPKFTIASWPNPSASIKIENLPVELREGVTQGTQDHNLEELQKVFGRYKSKFKIPNLYNFTMAYSVMDDTSYNKECGTTELTDPQPLPEQFRVSQVPHYGLCEIQCGSSIIVSFGNCEKDWKDWSYSINATTRSLCEDHLLIFTYIAPHVDPWQVYINCVTIGKAGDKIPDRAKADCAHTKNNGTGKGSSTAPSTPSTPSAPPTPPTPPTPSTPATPPTPSTPLNPPASPATKYNEPATPPEGHGSGGGPEQGGAGKGNDDKPGGSIKKTGDAYEEQNEGKKENTEANKENPKEDDKKDIGVPPETIEHQHASGSKCKMRNDSKANTLR